MPSERQPTQKSVVMLTADRQIDRRITLEAEALEAAGWSVTIIAVPPDRPEPDNARVVRLGHHSASQITTAHRGVLAVYKWMRRWLPMNSRAMTWLKAMAWRFFIDQENFYVKLFGPTVTAYVATVFQAHDLPMLAVARYAAERCGARLIYDSHELYCEQEFPEDVKRRWSIVEHKHIGACDAVMTVNPSIARELQRRYALKKVHVIYNAERPSTIERGDRSCYFHRLYSLHQDDKVLLFQGGITVGRNIENLVAAMKRVKNQRIHLVLLGNGALVQQLQLKVHRMALDRLVHFHAAVPQVDLLNITKAADAGIIPYQPICLNNYYCTPNKLFEFMAAGIPILGSDLPEIRAIVDPYGIGRVADLATAESTATAIDELFSDENRLQTWRAAAKAAGRTFSWDHEAPKVVAIFNGVCDIM